MFCIGVMDSFPGIMLSQDAEVGDGTTSVVLLAAEFLKSVKEFVEDGVHPRVRIRLQANVHIRLSCCALALR
jgi:hypothetical protein